jgi:hypothetical protein
MIPNMKILSPFERVDLLKNIKKPTTVDKQLTRNNIVNNAGKIFIIF